jgi:transposase
MTVKIKTNQTIQKWFTEQSKQAAVLYNLCLDAQFELANLGKKLLTAFDLAAHFRTFSLGSDYKDRIFERVADSTKKWVSSESLRYEMYWKSLEKEKIKFVSNKIIETKYPFLADAEKQIFRRKEYRKWVQRLARKQKIAGRPRYRKKCSLSFSIRKNRQNTIEIKKKKLSIFIPKFKGAFSGSYNFLPTTSDYQFKLATLKKDHCGTFWLKLTLEENIQQPICDSNSNLKTEKVLVGIDMGLKTTRTAVAVKENSKEIVSIYQPERVRYYEQGYNALVWASTKDTRHLSFVHRKIARRRLDNIGKDIKHILSMGDEFKFGKPSAAFLLSGRLARSASDAANSLFLTRFAKCAEIARKEAGEVDESYTSVTCRKCHKRKPMPLSERTYNCLSCDHTEDRDQNSGYQIAFRDFWHRV